jgi:hypothetical protein
MPTLRWRPEQLYSNRGRVNVVITQILYFNGSDSRH